MLGEVDMSKRWFIGVEQHPRHKMPGGYLISFADKVTHKQLKQ